MWTSLWRPLRPPRMLFSQRMLSSSVRNGYIILIPEIGEEANEKESSFLGEDGLPEFNTFIIEKCISKICYQTLSLEDGVKNVENSCENTKNIFTDVFIPLEHLESPLSLTWGLVKTLYLGNSILMPTKSYGQIQDKVLLAKTIKFNNRRIYNAVIKAKNEKAFATEEESRLLDKYLIEGHLNGLSITNKNKTEELETLNRKLALEIKTFRDKISVAIKLFHHNITNPEVVKHFPMYLLKNMAADPENPEVGPWKITHLPHVYDSFMEYCPNKLLRWNAWQANIRRNSIHEDRFVANSTTLENIRLHRRQKADYLGFETFADMSMQTKMVGSVKNVKNFINALVDRARPIQSKEIEVLEDFARENGFKDKFEQFDIPFWKREHRDFLFGINEDEIRDYFPLPVVLQGLFDLCTKLFDVKIQERRKVSTWHEDVRFFDVFDSNGSIPIASFYLDPYGRKNEKVSYVNDAGWVVPIRNRSTITDSRPLAAMIFNFQVPCRGKPSLLSFKEVHHLFHKFGFMLRHLLTESNYSELSGISTIEWDAAFVTGHVMTHWLFEPHIMKSISSHYSTQDSLPIEIINNFDNIRKHMAGYDLCKELYIARLDIELYSTKVFWRDIVKEIWPKYHALPYEEYDSHPCHLSKIVEPHGAASYFSDLWSCMLAADIYSAFHEVKNEEDKILEMGRRFRDTFLITGGGCHPSEVFRRFRGRDPSHKALLQVLGLIKTESNVRTE